MEDFVMTKSARAKKNVEENFMSVTYTSHKKKDKSEEEEPMKKSINEESSSNVDPRRQQEIEMKRLRWDVMKFGSSGFDKKTKHQAKVDLAIQLGARPPKNRKMNYKKLKVQKIGEKIRASKQQPISGHSKSLKKPKTRKKIKKDSGILGVYGTVKKTSS